MLERLLVWTRHRGGLVRWSQASSTALVAPQLRQYAEIVAAHAVGLRLDGAPHLHAAWIANRAAATPYTAPQRAALREFLAPFAPTVDADHQEAAVAEYLWHLLSVNDVDEPELVRITSPKTYTTAPGGDGLTVRRGTELNITLWEIKKHVGNQLDAVLTNAYGQLSAKGARYLTEFSSIGQLSNDAEESAKFQTIVEDWQAGAEHIRAGVAVATINERDDCFDGMRQHFASLRGRDPCSGLLGVVTDYPAFVLSVAEIVWTGL